MRSLAMFPRNHSARCVNRGGGSTRGTGVVFRPSADAAPSISSTVASSAAVNNTVRATTLTSLRHKIEALNARDKVLDEQMGSLDNSVWTLREFRAKVIDRATHSLENERARGRRQHERHVATLQSMLEQANVAQTIIDEERSRSVSQALQAS